MYEMDINSFQPSKFEFNQPVRYAPSLGQAGHSGDGMTTCVSGGHGQRLPGVVQSGCYFFKPAKPASLLEMDISLHRRVEQFSYACAKKLDALASDLRRCIVHLHTAAQAQAQATPT